VLTLLDGRAYPAQLAHALRDLLGVVLAVDEAC
jgi:hypothetical protein